MWRGFRQLAFGSGVGKLLGILREILLGALFGTGATVAAYRVAQTATLAPVNLVTADALSVGFLPNHAHLVATDPKRATGFYYSVQTLLASLSVLIGVLVFVLRGTLVDVISPGLGGIARGEAVDMLVVMAAGVPFYISTSLSSYLLMANGSYLLGSVRSSVQSVGLIVGTVLAFVLHRSLFLALGFTSAYVALAVFSFVYVRRRNVLVRRPFPAWQELTGDVTALWRAVRVVLWVPILVQGSIVAERAIASLVSVDLVAGLDYARLINDTAITLVAAPLGLVALSAMSTLAQEDMHARIKGALRQVVMLFVPLSLLGALNAGLIVQLLFKRGNFTETSVAVTSGYLTGLCAGLVFQVVAYFLTKVLNAQRRNGAAAVSVAIGAGLLVLNDVVLYHSLGAFGLGLGLSVSAFAQMTFCIVKLRMVREFGLIIRSSLPVALAIVTAAGIGAVAHLQALESCSLQTVAAAGVVLGSRQNRERLSSFIRTSGGLRR